MRCDGFSYSKISAELSMPVSTIKSFCQSNDLGGILVTDVEVCRNCGVKLKPSSQSAVKRFCSSACRAAWWKAHREAINRKAVHEIRCAYCGSEFIAYINGSRKFCSHACYAKSKVVRHG